MNLNHVLELSKATAVMSTDTPTQSKPQPKKKPVHPKKEAVTTVITYDS